MDKMQFRAAARAAIRASQPVMPPLDAKLPGRTTRDKT
jgi:hypothetical protein